MVPLLVFYRGVDSLPSTVALNFLLGEELANKLDQAVRKVQFG